MVMIQAVTISLATVQRTAETFFAAPTPIMQPVMVWVVDTGMPSSVAANSMAKLKFRPLHDRVVVKRIDAEEKSAGGIIIPDTAKEKPSQGEIIAVGPGGRDENGKLIPMDLKSGDRILFGKWSGTEVKLDGEELLIMLAAHAGQRRRITSWLGRKLRRGCQPGRDAKCRAVEEIAPRDRHASVLAAAAAVKRRGRFRLSR